MCSFGFLEHVGFPGLTLKSARTHSDKGTLQRRNNKESAMKLIATSVLLLSASLGWANPAEDEVDFTVAEYCELKSVHQHSTYQKQYTKAYEKKLGYKPSREQCLQEKYIKLISFTPRKQNWDFFQNKPYRGSAIRFSHNQVKKLRAAKLSSEDLTKILGSVDRTAIKNPDQ